MLSIKISKIPVYLRKSDFYKSLSEEDDEEITVPKCNMKLTTQVSTTTDLVHIFSTLQELPEPVLQFTMYICDIEAFNQIEDFEDVHKTVASLKLIRLAEGEQKVLRAAEFGRVDFIRYLLKTGNVLQYGAAVHAASNNHVGCLEFITDTLCETEAKPYKQVALHLLPTTVNYACWKHLHQHGAKLDKGAVTSAAAAGKLACLQYLHECNKARVTKRTMAAAVSNGHLACVAFIHEEGKIALDVEFAVLAASKGHLDCLKYLFERGCPKANKISTAAAKGGHVECLKYAHGQGCNMNKVTMTSTRCLDCIKYMRQQGVKWDLSMYSFALRGTLLEYLQYFHDQGLLCSKYSQHNVACTSDGRSLRFLYEHGAAVQVTTVRECILVHDNLICLKIAVEFGYEPGSGDCAVAAQHGAVRCLKYLHEAACPWDADTCLRAARAGKIDALKYAVQNGCPFDEATMAAAASYPAYRGDGVDCTKYLYEAGCPGDLRTTLAAAGDYYGLEKLQFAHEKGWPWDESVLNKATSVGNIDVITYLHEQGCSWSADTFAAALTGKSYHTLAVVQYLHENGCPWDSRVCTLAAEKAQLPVLQYAHEQGCPWTVEAFNAAATLRNAANYSPEQMLCLQYLHENGCPWGVTTTKAAASSGALTALLYLLQQGCPSDATTCAAAAGDRSYNGINSLKHLHERGVPWDESTTRAAAANRYSPASLQYALENGCAPAADLCTVAAGAQNLQGVRYAREQGCAWDHKTYQAAVEGGDKYLIAYLCDNGCPKTAQETDALALQKAWERAKVKHETANAATTAAVNAADNGCPKTAEETDALALQKAWERAKVKHETANAAAAAAAASDREREVAVKEVLAVVIKTEPGGAAEATAQGTTEAKASTGSGAGSGNSGSWQAGGALIKREASTGDEPAAKIRRRTG